MQIPSREEAFSYFGLDPNVKTLLVFGGSQGANFLNELMPKVATLLLQEMAFQVIHCTGKGNAVYQTNASCVKEFEPRMDLAYTAADIVICRSGASTVAELIRYGKPSLLIPFPYAAENHQWENAQLLADVIQGARLLKQTDASIESTRDEILALIQESPERKKALHRWNARGKIDLAAWILKEPLNG
jgi:UDP-N-acetylglucosamine--N-acetylmuramyl-(pentapeptide) pyrophosphoryl-undecaprenol N-acetylglucosamine transferase